MQHTFASISLALDQAEEADQIENAVRDIVDGNISELRFANATQETSSIALRVNRRDTPFGPKLVLACVSPHGDEYARQYFGLDEQKQLIAAMKEATTRFLSPTPLRQKLEELRRKVGSHTIEPNYMWHVINASEVDPKYQAKLDSQVKAIETQFPDATEITLK